MKSLPLLYSVLFLTGWVLAAQASLPAAGEQFMALPLAKAHGPESSTKILDRYGVPFIEDALPLSDHGSAEVQVGKKVDCIFLLGMTDANKPDARMADSLPAVASPRTLPLYGWADPRDSSARFMIGDELGRIQLNYADGTTQVFPLILGEGVWWGKAFYDYEEPFSDDARLRKAFAQAMRLYPPLPVSDGDYVAVIEPKAIPLQSITVENSPVKRGTLVIAGITLESPDTNEIAGATVLRPGVFPPDFLKFAKEKSLRTPGQDEEQAQRQLESLKQALYSSDESFKGPVARQVPAGYSGPIVSFKGDIQAEILANAFYDNVDDILAKIDETGMYHTSTKGAISWGGYRGFGTLRTGVGAYYGVSYTRDMGRSLQEITMLGFTNAAERCAAWALKMARLYTSQPSLKYKGVFLPPHWGDLANHPRNPSFENDGQGLTTMFLYQLWQRMPDRDAWLRANWPDIKDAGDWILWQLAHPEISGATNGLLHTSGESGDGSGDAIYPDSVCMNALRALAQMADSIGETNSAGQWRLCAAGMQMAIGNHFIIHDPKYGPVWSPDSVSWEYDASVLGPLIFLADYQGFAPQNEADDWRPVSEAAYQRLIDTYSPYQPFGFYGQAMGYGQGFVTQSALLLDRMHDATTMLEWTAKEIYDPRFSQFDHYIVPEGVQISTDGRYWYRFGDLGNGVQEGETIKTLRLVMGVDDMHPDHLQFYPRMPYGWNEVAVKKYPVVFEDSGQIETAFLHYTLKRSGKRMKLEIGADKDLGPVAMRLGPFEKQPDTSAIQVNGQNPPGASIQQSGDSWWVKFTMPVGLAK
ncbi:MAG TPA: hypothetical protein VK742_19590 [Candidatus Sulfotelmatobacter sp.]|nr:hypothetical protein [Candidatus Sulfotelmatobacter sp.]